MTDIAGLQEAFDRIAALERELAEARMQNKPCHCGSGMMTRSCSLCVARAVAIANEQHIKARDEDQAAIQALNNGLDELAANDFVPAWVAQQIAKIQEDHASAIRRTMGEGKVKTWNGADLKPCRCGSDDWESRDDVDHDDGSCEVFRCRSCGHSFHIELPD